MTRTVVLMMLAISATVVCGQWESDFRLTVDDSASQTSANSGWCVAASNDTVHVVWFDYRDDGDKIFYRRSTNSGVTWGPETRLTDTASASMVPNLSLAVAPQGRVHIVWCDYIRGQDDEIFYKRSTDGGTTWLPDTQLTRDDFRVEADSWVSIAAWNLLTHVVWHDFKWDGLRYSWNIFYKRSTDGGVSWQPDQRLTSYPATSGPPSVAVSGASVHVVWYDLRTGNAEIFYRRSTDGGATWQADTALTNDPAGSYLPSIAVASNMIHVSWFDERDGNKELYYKRSLDDGLTWGPDVRLTNDPADSYRPSVAVSGNNVHLAWYDNRDGNTEIFYKRSTDNGASWSPDTSLTNDANDSFYPSVALAGTKVHLVWTDNRDGNQEIYYKRNPTGNIGVAEKSLRLPGAHPLRVLPNPFHRFTRAIGRDNDWFVVCDASGRMVGRYKGKSIGADLASGVYFVWPLNPRPADDYRPSPLVKIR